jgi:hypothetical protein
MLLVRNSNIKPIWIKMFWYTTLKNVGGKSAKRMNSGISIGPYHGVLRIFLILTQVIEWAKHKY